MLNDAERRMLAEIESSLRAEDPRFVQRFYSRRRRPRPRGAVWLAFSVAMTVTLVTLLVGTALGVVVGLVAIGATIGMYASHRVQ